VVAVQVALVLLVQLTVVALLVTLVVIQAVQQVHQAVLTLAVALGAVHTQLVVVMAVLVSLLFVTLFKESNHGTLR
jgi:hypothetical protein